MWKQECTELLTPTNKTSSDIDQNITPYNLMVPRSCCPSCKQEIKAWQNIPVLSYLWLKGKCKHCANPISIQYPLVEAVTAILSIMVADVYGVTFQALAGIFLTWILVSLSMIDFKHTLLPDDITLPVIWVGLLMSLSPVFASPTDAIIGAAIGYLSLWSVYQLFKLVTGKEGMGFGDFKLLALFGAWFGWQSIPMIILLSSVVGAIVGLALIVLLGRDKNVPIPFGPYLAAAGWLSMLYGTTIQSWLP